MTQPSRSSRTFNVLLVHLSRVLAALTKLNKRAAKKGLPVLEVTQGKAYTEAMTYQVRHDGDSIPMGARALGGGDYSIDVVRVPLTLTGETPCYAGYTFVAALQHLDGENVIRAVPGETVPAEFRSRGPVCDHCKQNRRRNDTYVVRHEDGHHVQVGSTCIADFLGSDDAGRIAAQAEFFALAGSAAEDGEEGFGGGFTHDRMLSDFLGWVSFAVREHGWTSRTAAKENGGQATVDLAWPLMVSEPARREYKKSTGREALPTPEDSAAGEAAEAWAETITDAEIDAASGDYLHNIRTIARAGLVTSKTAGLGGSILVAHQRAIAKARKAAERAARPVCNEYLGAVGEKVTFGLPPVVGRKGQPLKNSPTVLTADPLTLDFVGGFEGSYGYTTVLSFRTAAGHTVVWFASGADGHPSREDVGKQYTLAGTIKKHNDREGKKQTVMTRCTVLPVVEEVAS